MVIEKQIENPFTQRGRIVDARFFIGRWRELSLIFDRLAAGRPVLVIGPPGAGKSSLLTHVTQSAAINLERPDLRAFYADLAQLPDAGAFYELVVRALNGRGATPAALEVMLLEQDGPLLLCLDGVDAAIAAGWGDLVLERLARMARATAVQQSGIAPANMAGGELLLLAALRGPAPVLSEPFTTITLGALAPTEVRLLADAYLDETGVEFSAAELRALTDLSAGSPAYLQRAAYHLFIAHTRAGYDWRRAYLNEAREQPLIDAPLPPSVFEGSPPYEETETTIEPGEPQQEAPRGPRSSGVGGFLALLAALVAALLVVQFGGSWWLAGLVLAAGITLAVLIDRGR